MLEIQDISNDLFKIGKFTYSKGDYFITYKNLYGDKDGINLKNKYTDDFIFDNYITYDNFIYNSSSFTSNEELTNILANIIVPFTVDINSLATTGSNIFIGNQGISGSLNVSNGVTGSLYGTSSYSLIADELKDFTKPINYHFINSKNDFPPFISGSSLLEDNKTYFITNTIDLLGDRLIGGSNTTIIGASSEISILTSTGLGSGSALLSSIYSTPIRNIAINNVNNAVNFDGTSNPNDMALDWTGVNFVNVPNVGTIKKASNFIFDKGAFLNSKGLIFDGTIGTVALNNSLFSGDGLAGNILQLLSTCIITRRFRVIYSSFISSNSTIGINVSTSSSIPVESYILDTVNFGGDGTYLSGVTVIDNKSLFTNCKGIPNTNEVSQYYMNNNAITTIVSATNTPYKVSGTTTSASITQKFTNISNRATYVGSLTRFFKVVATLSLESGNNNQIGCYIAKNGTILAESEVYGTTSGAGRAENIVVQTLVELTTNDYIEIFVENSTSINNILVTDLNTIIQ